MAVWEILERAGTLRATRQPFALAAVVRCERPASAKPGDQALVTIAGTLEGWVGGSCTEPVIIREALAAIEEEEARLVRLGPPDELPAEPPAGMVAHPMTCHSGGTLEIFVDPCLPAPQVVLVGHSPVVATLAELAVAIGYDAIVCDPDGPAHSASFPAEARLLPALDPEQVILDARSFVVVSTHGEADEDALATALQSSAGYVALVASRRRADSAREILTEMGVTAEQLGRLQSPAGLDIGAQTPQEIAASIVAEIIHVRRTRSVDWMTEKDVAVQEPEIAIDPVCGMTVEITPTTPASVYEQTTYYFCCAGCQRRFEQSPREYLVAIQG